jgi:hypothetical protein
MKEEIQQRQPLAAVPTAPEQQQQIAEQQSNFTISSFPATNNNPGNTFQPQQHQPFVESLASSGGGPQRGGVAPIRAAPAATGFGLQPSTLLVQAYAKSVPKFGSIAPYPVLFEYLRFLVRVLEYKNV